MSTRDESFSWLIKPAFGVFFLFIALFLLFPGDNASARMYFKQVPCPENTCCGGGNTQQPSSFPLYVSKNGSGTVTSSPPAINCGTMCSAYFDNGSIVELTATPASGWEFHHWSGACSGAGQCSVTMYASRSVTATFYASLTVTRVGPGTVTSSPAGIDCGATCSASFADNTSVTLTATPDAGYIFQGWSGECTGTGSCVVTMSQGRNVTATFGPWLTVTDNGLGTVTSTPTGINCGGNQTCMTAFQNNSTVTLTATPAADWVFAGWSGASCSGTGSCVVTMSGNQSVMANFNPILTVTRAGPGTVTSSPAGIDCGVTCGADFPYNSSVSLTATPDPGYVFLGWSGACSGSGVCDLTMFDARSVSAQFGANLTVSKSGSGTLTSNPVGIDCGSICSANFAYNTVINLTATPDSGWAFVEWSGDCTGSSVCTITIDSSKNVTATFEPILSVTLNGSGTVISNPSGIDCGTSCSAGFPYNSTVTLTATPSPDWAFINWSGDCSGTTCSLLMDSPKNVAANFLPLYPLTVTLSGSGTVTSNPAGIDCGSDCSEKYISGTTVTLIATPAPGYVFDAWTGACNDVATSCDILMDSAKNITATFLPLYTLSVSSSSNGKVVSLPQGIDCGTDCSEQFVSGTEVVLIPEPDPGYTLTGWSEPSCTDPSACIITLQNDMSVSATFGPIPNHILSVSVTNPSAGTVTSDPAGIDCGATCAASYTEGELVILTPQPSEGYTFGSWSGACSGNADCPVVMESDQSVMASFTPLYAVTVNASGEGSGSVTGTVTTTVMGSSGTSQQSNNFTCDPNCVDAYAEGTSVTLQAVPAPDAEFEGWGGDCSGTGDCTLSVTNDQHATAFFRIRLVQLTVTMNNADGSVSVTSDPAGINCPGNCTAYFPINERVFLNATASPTANFEAWAGDCETYNAFKDFDYDLNCTIIMNSNKSVWANYGPYLLSDLFISIDGTGTVTSSNGSINCPPDCSGDYLSGLYQTITASGQSLAAGMIDTYQFANQWSLESYDCNDDPTRIPLGVCEINGESSTGTMIFDAHLTGINYPVTLHVAGPGRVVSEDRLFDCRDPNCGTIYYAEGSHTDIIPYADAGMEFTGWSSVNNGCNGLEPWYNVACQLGISGPVDLTATFGKPDSTLTVEIPGGGSVTSTPAGIDCPSGNCSATFPTDSSITLTATPDPGSIFLGWGGACYDSNPTCTFTLDGNRTVTANFAAPLRVNIQGSGSVSLDTTSGPKTCWGGLCSFYDYYGSLLTLTATPATSAEFSNWSGGPCNGSQLLTCDVLLNGSEIITAVFKGNVTVSKDGNGSGKVVSYPYGINCDPTCNASFQKGTYVFLSPQPLAGSTIPFPNHWGGDCAGQNHFTCRLYMDGRAKNATVTFDPRF